MTSLTDNGKSCNNNMISIRDMTLPWDDPAWTFKVMLMLLLILIAVVQFFDVASEVERF